MSVGLNFLAGSPHLWSGTATPCPANAGVQAPVSKPRHTRVASKTSMYANNFSHSQSLLVPFRVFSNRLYMVASMGLRPSRVWQQVYRFLRVSQAVPGFGGGGHFLRFRV